MELGKAVLCGTVVAIMAACCAVMEASRTVTAVSNRLTTAMMEARRMLTGPSRHHWAPRSGLPAPVSVEEARWMLTTAVRRSDAAIGERELR